eukprot:gene7507-8338_t
MKYIKRCRISNYIAFAMQLLIFLLQFPIASTTLNLHVQPSTVLTTQTRLTATVKITDSIEATLYKFSFDNWSFKTIQNKIMHTFSQPGVYYLKASALVNSTWLAWTTKEILVFDHNTVIASQCLIDITSLTLIQTSNSTGQQVPQGSNPTAQIIIQLRQCHGRYGVTINETTINSNKHSSNTVANIFTKHGTSFGAEETTSFVFNVTSANCIRLDAQINLITPTETASRDKNYTSNCLAKNTKPTPRTIPDLRPNTIIAVFYIILLLLYIIDVFIAYRGQKQILKPVQDLTDQCDEHMFEVRFHIGSALSIKATKCTMQFNMYGTHDVTDPIKLPTASFEDDGMASFLVSTAKEIGDVGTIGIFCKNMDLSSDWFLRKVEVFKHSEKPNGTHWSDDDVITKVADFECHSWFSPASSTQSISQVFHKNNERLRTSLPIDYASRCKQLFLQKHVVTSWTCSFGKESFTKMQRLALLYSIILLLTCASSLYITSTKWDQKKNTVDVLHIGVIRLNAFTTTFALVSAACTYFLIVIASILFTLVHWKSKGKDDSVNQNYRPLHIDVVRSRVVPYKKNRSVSFRTDNNGNRTRRAAYDAKNKAENNILSNGINHGAKNENHAEVSMQDVSIDISSEHHSLDSNGVAKQAIIEPPMNIRLNGMQQAVQSQSDYDSNFSGNGLDSSAVTINIDDNDDAVGLKEYNAIENEVNSVCRAVGTTEKLGSYEIDNGEDVTDSDVKTSGIENHGFDKYEIGQEANGSTPIQDGDTKIQDGVSTDDGLTNTVQFLNRETLPTVKENKLKACLQVLLDNAFWIAHILLLSYSAMYSLIYSASWTNKIAYYWVSMSMLGVALCCCLFDTFRVLVYVLIITIKERRQMSKVEREMTFDKYTRYLQVSKRAEFDNRQFFNREFPEQRLLMVKNHYRLKGKVNDFLIFALFVVILLVLTQWTMNSKSFRFWGTLENYLFKLESLLSIQSSNSVDPVVNFWNWMRLSLPSLLNSTKRDISMRQIHVIGQSLNLIQKRIKKGKCKVPKYMRPLINECNIDYNAKYEDRTSYSKGWRTALNATTQDIPNSTATASGPWQFQRSIMLKEMSLDSEISYSFEGYVATFNASNINKQIDELIKYKWIDKYTRMLYLEVFVYDSSTNFLSPCVIALEFTASSYISVTRRFFNFILFPDSSPGYELVMYAELAFFVMTFYFIYDIFTRKQRMSSTWLSGWLVTEALVIILSFVVTAIVALKNLRVFNLSHSVLSSNLQAEKLHEIAHYQRILEQVLANLNLLSIALMVKPLFTLGLFDDMYLAVMKTLIDMKGIALETMVIIIAFLFWARAAFVATVQKFSTFGSAFPTLMDMLVRPDNEDLYNEGVFGALLLLTYYVIMIMLISNLFISAVQQSYSRARRAFEDMEKATFLKYFVKSFNSKATKRLMKGNMAAGTFRRRTNIKRLDSPVPNSTKKQGEAEEEGKEDQNSQTDKLYEAVDRLEAYLNGRVVKENIEDRVLVTAMSDGWKKVVEKKPVLQIISIYKKHIKS